MKTSPCHKRPVHVALPNMFLGFGLQCLCDPDMQHPEEGGQRFESFVLSDKHSLLCYHAVVFNILPFLKNYMD